MRSDERDTPFARMGYRPGSREYSDYYARNPHREASDASLRGMPPLGDPQTVTYNPWVTPVVEGFFSLIAAWHPLADIPPSAPRKEGNPEEFTHWLKGVSQHLGASKVATLAIEEQHYYSHRGRRAQDYGQAICDTLPYAAIFAIPMDRKLIAYAPKAPEMLATVGGYLEGAKVALGVAYSVRELGYRCRVHIDGHYLMPLRKLALDSGLGVLGHNGLILTEQEGACVRLAAIDTDMPLLSDAPDPRQEHITAFCALCKRCERSCSVLSDSEECYKRWRTLGTDCGSCIRSCPLSNDIAWESLALAREREKVIERLKESRFSPVAPDQYGWF